MILNAVILAACLLLHAAPVLADPPAPSFATGFDMLNALVPGQDDAARSWRARSVAPPRSNNALREITRKLDGHGWLLTPGGGKTETFIPFGELASIAVEPGQSPSPADLEQDVNTIIEAVSRLERADSAEDFKRSWNDAGSITFGPLMIFAAQLHQAGHPALADQLAWSLFQAAPNREVVIDAAINHIGDHLYQAATRHLLEGWDWQTYHDTISTLIQSLPRGWDAQPAVIMVAGSVARNLDQPTPPAPTLEDQEIDPQAIESLAWLTTPPDSDAGSSPAIPGELAAMLAQLPAEQRMRFLQNQGYAAGGNTLSHPGFWTLEPPDESHPATPTLKLGVRAIPALAALLGDEHPVHFVNPGASGGRSYYSHHNNPIERAIEIHKSMLRPATRDDVARMMLQPILPDTSGSLQNADPDTLRIVALEFHQAHQTHDTGQLAAAYITEGSDPQKNMGATFLAKSPEPTHHTLFESRILDSPSAVAHLSSVLIYTQQRKTEAKPFLAKYLPEVRDEIGDGSDVENMRELSWELRQPGHLTQMLRQIESLADGKSATDSAREIATGPAEDADAAIQALMQSISSSPTEKQTLVLLAGATAATDPKIRFAFITNLFRIRNVYEEEEGEGEPPPPALPEDQREAWATLITDTRPIDPEWEAAGWLPADGNLGHLAAMAAEYIIDPTSFYEVNQQTGILKTTVHELCMARIKARIADEPLPILPDPENITPDRLKEIITTAGTKPASDIIPYLDTLTPDERAAWSHWIQKPGDIPPPATVRELAVTIIEANTKTENGMEPTPGLLDLTPGLQFHEDTIDAYIHKLAENAPTHSLCFGNLNTVDFPPGLTSWTLRAEIPKADEDKEVDEFNYMHPIRMFQGLAPYFQADGVPDEAEALIVCNYYDAESHSNNAFNWWVVSGKPVPFNVSDRGEISTEVENTLAKTLATARENAKQFMLRIQVITREHAAKLADE